MRLALAVLLGGLIGCSKSGTDPVRDFNARVVTLPNGTKITCDVMTNQVDVTRGLMFRESLPQDRGMLFVHATPSKYYYWTLNLKFPIDIIWMDSKRRVVEIAANAPPCPSKIPKECPNYGGHENAVFILEVNGGVAARSGVDVGTFLDF